MDVSRNETPGDFPSQFMGDDVNVSCLNYVLLILFYVFQNHLVLCKGNGLVVVFY